MGYRFPLATVLRVRELAAEQEERTLGRIAAEIERLRGLISSNEAELVETARARQQALGSVSLPAMHLQVFYASVEDLRARGALLHKQLARFEELRLQQIVRFEEAYRRREILASLQAEQQHAREAAERKREEQAAGEVYLARFAQRVNREGDR